ncbi:MAG: molybdenum cofactor biosynthesis protein B [Halobacteriales archaeon]
MVDFHERDTQSGHTSLAEPADTGESGNVAEDSGADSDNGDETATTGDPPASGADDGHDHHEHDHDDHHAHDLASVRVAVVTVSSTRTLDDDPSGDAIVESFEAAGHEIATRELVADDLDGVQGRLDGLVRRADVDVVVSTGGTGVTPDDVTVEAVRPLLEKELPGFGELFRRRSEADIGTRVVATRALAGIADGVPVFCLPGSEAAARLGADEIIVPEAGHLAGLARRDEAEE